VGVKSGDWQRTAGDVVAALSVSLKGAMRPGFQLAGLTSFKVGGPAGVFVEPADEHDLLAIASIMNKFNVASIVLGRGTNVLVSDEGFDGIVIRLGDSFEWIRGNNDVVVSGGATPLPQVANWAARRSLTGMEFAIAIPATVGGAVRMNAGAHGEAISKVILTASVCRMVHESIEVLDQGSLEMRYRDSALGPLDVVSSASFQLRPGDRSEIAKTMAGHRQHRTATQPSEGPNAGSVFRNPPGYSAGKLIESAHMKGLRVGQAQVSTKHGNFIVAHPGAKAQEVFDLMAELQAGVLDKFDICLLPEIRLIGNFAGSNRLILER